ncbi:MAG TPA: hypothetical protein VHS26_03935, partial [Solirubrobacteraceae bacterium]|nr:hypothetical protein [Solirubrobacteraceae bacterium]
HERSARRAEAVEAFADLAHAVHDCDVVTELPASPPLLEPELLDSLPLDWLLAPAPLEPVVLEPVLLDFVALATSADLLEPVVLVLLDFADSAGSWPDASCS